jgi:hypothetical protein
LPPPQPSGDGADMTLAPPLMSSKLKGKTLKQTLNSPPHKSTSFVTTVAPTALTTGSALNAGSRPLVKAKLMQPLLNK